MRSIATNPILNTDAGNADTQTITVNVQDVTEVVSFTINTINKYLEIKARGLL